MQNLENVTLIIVDCVNPLRAEHAIKKCTSQINFKEVLFLSDKENGMFPTVKIDPIKSKLEYSQFIIRNLYKYIRGTHCLLIQWDGYVLHPEVWNPKWLEYDYIGARWNFHKDKFNVGNGGFSLRSKRLMEIVATDENIIEIHPEDNCVCRWYRPYLEYRYGIKYAPPEVADLFSDENSFFRHKTFGYHGGIR